MKPLLLPYIFNIVVLIPVGLTPFGGRGGQAVGLPGQVTGGCRDSHDLELFLDADRDWLGDRAVPPGLDVAGPVDPGHLQLTLARRLRCAPPDSRSLWRSELGNRWDVPFHRSVLSLGDPLGQGIQRVTIRKARSARESYGDKHQTAEDKHDGPLEGGWNLVRVPGDCLRLGCRPGRLAASQDR